MLLCRMAVRVEWAAGFYQSGCFIDKGKLNKLFGEADDGDGIFPDCGMQWGIKKDQNLVFYPKLWFVIVSNVLSILLLLADYYYIHHSKLLS